MALGRKLKAAWYSLWPTSAGGCEAHACAGDRRLSALLSAAPAIVYAADAAPPHAITYISANVCDETGYPGALLRADVRFWPERIHEHDRADREAAIASLPNRGEAAVEYRYRHGNGEWRWIRDQMRCLRDADGAFVEIVGSLVDITDHRESQEALARSERQLHAIQRQLTDALESSEDAFSVYDAKDELVQFNSRLRTFFPLVADVIQPGVRFEDLARTGAERGQFKGVTPELIEGWLKERMGRRERPSGSFEQRLSDGRCLEIVERPTAEGGRVAVLRDVTARKQIEEALRQELRFEQTILDSLPLPVFFKGINGRLLGCNAKLSKFSGRPITDIVGRTIQELVPAERLEEYERISREVLSAPGVRNYELTMQRGDGQFRRINLVTGTFNGSDGQVAGYIGSLIDITEQKRAEEQLVQAAKLATLGQIASEVAHELNQPLSIIRMTAESLLSHSEPNDPQAQRLSTIVRQVCRMAEMVDHLRSFSRVEGGEKRPFSLPEVVSAAASLLIPHFQLDGIELDIRTDKDCPLILGRPNQIEQVVLNLLTNARDAVRAHRPDGGKVSIAISVEHEWARLTVTDNGGGIPAAVLGSIFDAFFTTKGEGAGTGLGLSICSNILSGMGGGIEAINTGDGASFIVSLPLSTNASAPAPTVGNDAPAPCHGKTRTSSRILVVDDETLAVDCIADFLEARDFQVLTATNSARALDIAADGVDLVITDMRMPGMGGMDLLDRLRQEQPGLPAILMTGGPLPEHRDDATLSIRKPLALEELLGNVNALLTERHPVCSP